MKVQYSVELLCQVAAIPLYINDKILQYTGLEHRNPLRTLTSILTCKLKFEIDNWKFGKNLEIWEKMEILKRFGNWDKF